MENYTERSWFSKNWPWVLPAGCCSGCLILIIVSFLGIGGMAFSFFNSIADSFPVDEILIEVNQNPRAIEVLGENIVKTSFMPSGEISTDNHNGEAKFIIGVMGDKAKGTLYVNGIRSNKKWIYEDLYIIEKETVEEINLLED